MGTDPRGLYDRIDRQLRKAMVPEVQAWFLDERDEEIGDLAAGFLLEMVTNLVGPEIYNLALADALKLIQQYDDLLVADLGAQRQDPAVRPAKNPD